MGLGSSLKKIGKAVVGGVTGFVSSGFNPAGAVAGFAGSLLGGGGGGGNLPQGTGIFGTPPKLETTVGENTFRSEFDPATNTVRVVTDKTPGLAQTLAFSRQKINEFVPLLDIETGTIGPEFENFRRLRAERIQVLTQPQRTAIAKKRETDRSKFGTNTATFTESQKVAEDTQDAIFDATLAQQNEDFVLNLQRQRQADILSGINVNQGILNQQTIDEQNGQLALRGIEAQRQTGFNQAVQNEVLQVALDKAKREQQQSLLNGIFGKNGIDLAGIFGAKGPDIINQDSKATDLEALLGVAQNPGPFSGFGSSTGGIPLPNPGTGSTNLETLLGGGTVSPFYGPGFNPTNPDLFIPGFTGGGFNVNTGSLGTGTNVGFGTNTGDFNSGTGSRKQLGGLFS